MIIDQLGKIRSRQIFQSIFRDKLAMAIKRHDLPFSFVEYEGIRDVLKYLNPDVKFVTRNTIAMDVWKYYEQERLKLKEVLNATPVEFVLQLMFG